MGLKVTNVKEGDEAFHGNHSGDPKTPWYVFEETDHSGEKDTSKMLQAGAERVFFIRTSEAWMKEAYDHFIKLIPPGSLIVCESRSLRTILKPGIFVIMLRDAGPGEAKDMTAYLKLANEICTRGNDLLQIDNLISRIHLGDSGWHLE